ncbi:MAG: YtxH domain-containing protein [Candidatus Levybacteria bacterium]|nr:YtxH domain-containing protein [Candidatus Levybacteria bacterium]
MEQPNNKQQSNGNGFILGLVVGIMIALLFTTKKGRAILRDVTEKGIDQLSKLENLKQQVEDSELFDELEEDEYVKAEPALEVQPIVKEPEPKETAPEKPVAKPTPVKAAAPAPKAEPKVVEPEPEIEEVPEEVASEEPQEKAQSKVIQGRRWFKGLRKKG